MQTPDNRRWYAAGQAAGVMSKNSGKEVDTSYVHKLSERGKIAYMELSPGTRLYDADQVDQYVVKEPGRPTTKQKPARKRSAEAHLGGARAGAGRPRKQTKESV